MRIQVGCGMSPIAGWENFDNSLAVVLARMPVIGSLIVKFRLLNAGTAGFIKFLQSHPEIRHARADRLPLASGSVDAYYSSHCLEHMSEAAAQTCLKEAYRVVRPGGVIRIAVPDLDLLCRKYLADRDSRDFLAQIHLSPPEPDRFVARLKNLILGYRNHLWMYDGVTLAAAVEKAGFVTAKALRAGESAHPQALAGVDLSERGGESVYVEATKR